MNFNILKRCLYRKKYKPYYISRSVFHNDLEYELHFNSTSLILNPSLGKDLLNGADIMQTIAYSYWSNYEF